jgi:hypothetical protein
VRQGRNVTYDPLAQAQLAPKPAIKTLMGLETGEFFTAQELVETRTYEAVVRLRNVLREGLHRKAPKLVCDQCLAAAYLVSSTTKRFFFRHVHEDGSCTAVTRAGLTADQIKARQYQGLRESDAHRALKDLIEASLLLDPAFTDVAVERTWRGAEGWRRPDVSGSLGGLRLAFEGQLSTTFLSVVIERRAFYQDNSGLLVWVLGDFDPDNRRMTEDDIVFPNNANVLVVDNESLAASRAAGRFVVKVWHRSPRAARLGQAAQWICQIVAFAELTLDSATQRAFLVDVEGQEAATKAAEAEAARLAREAALRGDFLAFLEEDQANDEEEAAAWSAFEGRFLEAGVALPERPWVRGELQRWQRLVRTALSGEVFGWGFNTLPQVAHHLHDQHPGLLYVFGWLLQASGHAATLKAQDGTHKWRQKADRLRTLGPQDRERFKPDLGRLELLLFLFPDAAPTIADRLDSEVAKEVARQMGVVPLGRGEQDAAIGGRVGQR